jgi:hypothetical protein
MAPSEGDRRVSLLSVLCQFLLIIFGNNTTTRRRSGSGTWLDDPAFLQKLRDGVSHVQVAVVVRGLSCRPNPRAFASCDRRAE